MANHLDAAVETARERATWVASDSNRALALTKQFEGGEDRFRLALGRARPEYAYSGRLGRIADGTCTTGVYDPLGLNDGKERGLCVAWEEWEQLKTAAAERRGTGMRLNQIPADSGGSGSGAGGGSGTGRLRHTRGPWTRAATVADDLHTSTVKSKADLALAHDDMAGPLGGLASLAMLKAVLASWENRLGTVRDECSTLGPKLREVAVDMGEVDQAVSTEAGAVHVSGSGKG